jgi:predicted dehydrogenase
VTLEFSKGRMAQFYVGFGTELRDQFQVTGTKGSIILDNAYRFATTRRLTVQNDKLQVENFPETDNFSGMISYFAECLQNGSVPLADGSEGLTDMEAMVAIEQAAKEIRPVAVPQRSAFKSTYQASMARNFPPAREKLLV